VIEPDVISVLIACGDAGARDTLVSLLTPANGVRVVGTARDGAAALALARQTRPDVVLVDVDLPPQATQMTKGAGDGIATVETLSSTLWDAGLILLAPLMDADLLRRAMMAGAREFLPMPAPPSDVLQSIRRVHTVMAPRRAVVKGGAAPAAPARRDGQIIAVFSPKGGVGRTTLVTNLAVEIRRRHDLSVVVVDGSLPFGDVGVFFDLPPTHSIVDLQVPEAELDAAYIETALLLHPVSGVKALLAPPRPEMAEMVTDELLRRTLRILRERYDYIIVDTSPALDERVLTALEAADKILLVLSSNLAALKSAKAFLEVANLLQFPPNKVTPVVTCATTTIDITLSDIEVTLGRQIEARIPSDERAVTHAINVGDPLTLSAEGTPIALAIAELARRLVTEGRPELAGGTPSAPGPSRPRPFKLFRSS